MEDSLRKFLTERNAVSNEVIFKMENEKIDIEAIMSMTSDELKEYVPAIGDRLAVINFCRSHSDPRRSSNRTLSLLEKLKKGQGSQEPIYKKPKTDDYIRPLGRKPLPTRKIQLGWIHNGTPLRQKKGGGRRELRINKCAKKDKILKKALEIYFSEGKSIQGKLQDFEYDLLDFQHSVVNDKLTVGEIYNITKLNVLRFYLITNDKTKKIKTTTAKNKKTPRKTSTTSSLTSSLTTNSSTSNNSTTNDSSSYDISEFLNFGDDSDMLQHKNYNVDTTTTSKYNLSEDDDIFPETNDSQDEVSFFNLTEDTSLFETNDVLESTIRSPKTVLLKLYRGRVFEELLEAFQQNVWPIDDLKVEMILPNGDTEKADDMGGVLRDTLTEFWESFYDRCTYGAILKVPYLRHDLKEQQWTAIAKILIKGYSQEKYFPIKLAPTFIGSCFGNNITDKDLLEDFKKYVSESEAELFDEALNNFDPKNDEMMELFTRFGSKWLPKEDNVQQLIRDIAHREIIQKPAFVARCFMNQFSNCKDLQNCLQQIILDEANLDESKRAIFEYLKKFIRESDDKQRSQFLRFCTGSDLPVNEIRVSFEATISSEYKRSPVAHTCTGNLIMPLGYENYIDFRNEFKNVLNSNVWIMDII